MVSMMQDSQDLPELSVVFLCYWAEDWAPRFAEQLLREFEEVGVGYELIPVANYLPSDVDRDRTPEIARQFAMAFAALRCDGSCPRASSIGWRWQSKGERCVTDHTSRHD